jgi:hypothetical protein
MPSRGQVVVVVVAAVVVIVVIVVVPVDRRCGWLAAAVAVASTS